MSDITKCTNELCEIKKTCYRWTVTAHEYWQSWCKFEPQEADGVVTCEHKVNESRFLF